LDLTSLQCTFSCFSFLRLAAARDLHSFPTRRSSDLPEDPDAPFDFPDKTILIKHFYYPLDFRKPEGEKRVIETRLLIKNNGTWRSEEHTSELQSRENLVCRLLLEKKKNKNITKSITN